MKRFKQEPSHLSGARVLLRSCNAFSVGFLGLAYKTVQLSRASLKNCHVSSQDDRTTGLNV